MQAAQSYSIQYTQSTNTQINKYTSKTKHVQVTNNTKIKNLNNVKKQLRELSDVFTKIA